MPGRKYESVETTQVKISPFLTRVARVVLHRLLQKELSNQSCITNLMLPSLHMVIYWRVSSASEQVEASILHVVPAHSLPSQENATVPKVSYS